jgi:hypothetical protein
MLGSRPSRGNRPFNRRKGSPMTDGSQKAPERAPRAKRILTALIGGEGLEAIVAREKLAAKRIVAIVREELGRRWVPPSADFAKLQIARLQELGRQLVGRVNDGELEALDRALKILDRLDRYHGFSRASPALEPYGEEERERLLNKLNAAAARLEAGADEDKRAAT